MKGVANKQPPEKQGLSQPAHAEKLRPVLTFVTLALGLAVAGLLVYVNEKQQLAGEIEQQLVTIAELKVRQIEAWRNERLGDAEIASRTGLIGRQVEQLVSGPERQGLKNEILDWMVTFQQASGYRSIVLVNGRGKPVLGTGETRSVGSHGQQMVLEAIRSGRPVLSDIHTASAAPFPHLDLAAPVFATNSRAVGAFLFRIDPAAFLYPLLSSWPVPSRTGESVLFRVEGDHVLFLNQLRYGADTALQLSLPLREKRNVAVLAAQDRAGVLEGIDYRNVPVLAVAARVSGTAWFLIAKIDQDEVFEPLRKRAWYIGLTTMLLISAGGITVLFWFRKKDAEDRRRQMEAEYERQSLRERYDYLSKYANDIILLLDGTGKVIEANDRAIASFGYPRQELLGLTLRELRPPRALDDLEGQMKMVRERNGFVFETENRRKDGSTFPAETSSREIMTGGKTVYQFIIRDISERKQAEQQLRESQKLLQAIIETEPECINLLSREGVFLMMNRAGLEMFEADSFDQVKGQHGVGLVKPEHRADFTRVIQEVFQGRSTRLEFEITGFKGRSLWLEAHVVPLRDESDRITSLLSVSRDITERKKAERSIRAITRLYAVLSQIDQAVVRSTQRKDIFENVCRIIVWYGQFKMAWIGILDQEGREVRLVAASGADDAFRESVRIPGAGEPEEDPVSLAVRTGRFAICNDIEKEARLAGLREESARYGYRSTAAFPMVVKGKTIGALTICSDEKDFFSHDEVELLDEVARDVSFALESLEREEDRRQAEAALIREKNRSAALLAAIGDGISIQDRDFKVLYQNTQHIAIAGLHTGEYCYQAYAHRSEICEGCPVALAMQDGTVHTLEKKTDGNGRPPRHFEIAASVLRDEEGRVLAGIEALREITDRKQAEQRLAESEHRYKLLVESITDYIYTVKVENGRPVSTIHGPGCLSVTGFSSTEFEHDRDLWYRIIHGEDRAMVLQQANNILSGQHVAPFEHRIVHKDGSLRWIRNTPVPRFNDAGALIDYDGLISNITALKQLEAQLRQAQKMEAVGQLAGGIAHDFNNILTAIIGYGNLLRMKLPSDTPLRTYVEQILASSERAANLTHSLLAFSRKQIIDLKAIDINAVIARVERMLQRVIGEDVEFRTSIAPGTLPVLADSVQIEQVLMNLVTNARDAMPNGGLLEIETSRFEMGEEFQRTHAYGKPGSYALIVVSDTGVGMDDRTRAKIFDPFFTTKEVGKGTGLGLAMVYGIVKQHGGYINVYSEPGKGSSFKIYLPLTSPPEQAVPAQAPDRAHQGTETVLLAEDDEEVRRLTRTVLQDFGYRVIEAVDGEEAVSRFSADPDAVDLLVFDMIMPKKNGKEAYLEIRGKRPSIKALFMSGYTADIAHKKGILDTGLDFVLKPVSPTELLKKVRDVLDRS